MPQPQQRDHRACNGTGGFTTPTTLATQSLPNDVAVGDFNGDGNADLAVTNQLSSVVTILLGNGRGGFTAAPQSPATGPSPYSVVVGDFNDDGNQDLAVTNQFSKTVTVLIGDGKGNFTAEFQSPTTGINPDSVAVADFNGDGKQDVVVANSNDNTATILLGMGDGTFPASQRVPLASGTAPYSAAVADFDIDGRPDFAVAGSGNNTAVFVLNTVTSSASAGLSGNQDPRRRYS